MVIRTKPRRDQAALATECAIALGILATVMIPLAVSFIHETKLCRAYYHKAVALEIIDGEMEALVAGEWRAFQPGQHPYTTQAAAATNLPPGKFVLNLEAKRVRLDWIPSGRNQGGIVSREVQFK